MTVYEILSANRLCQYYDLEKNPGRHLNAPGEEDFLFLDDADIREKVIAFDSPSFAKVTFQIPAIHCISCVWLLEKLHKIHRGILRSEVNFPRRKVYIDFDPRSIALSTLARLLASLGYGPEINLEAEHAVKPRVDRSLVIKISVAGFCFGNVMLFSFPEYLGIDHTDGTFFLTFSWLNLVLSVPVLFYSAWGYLRSAASAFGQKQINIDVPIAVGLLALFFRSAFDIVTATGPGYLDSFTGLVFFLLIGRWFQSKTYENLAFNRDFTSYFPLAVSRLTKDEWKPVVIYKLQRNDIIRIRNLEIIPADARLLDETAHIDYSFVTGESRPVTVRQGDLLFAGGRLVGTPVRLVVDRKTSHSHLTTLWNHDAFRKVDKGRFQKIIDRSAQKFTWAVLAIAFITGLYWQFTEPLQMWLVVTSVLMVACPCALALAAPFTFGSTLRAFGDHRLYLKSADVIERMAGINAVVFDKTGTVTHGHGAAVSCEGDFSKEELLGIKTLTGCSTHPLSQQVCASIADPGEKLTTNFREIPGKGIEGVIDGHTFRIGSSGFTGSSPETHDRASTVFVAIDGLTRGCFRIRTSVRKNFQAMLSRLGKKCVGIVSGDSEGDRHAMQQLFPSGSTLLFNQRPQDKLTFIADLQKQGKKVLMAGDGLNDAGALRQSDVGIAVTDDTGIFTPACDAILDGKNVHALDRYLDMARSSLTIVKTGFGISFFYNAVAITIAVTGHLTPLAAAVLMPLSSISVVTFSTVAVNALAKKNLGTLK
jgi:Cu+-exporting ATPase